MINGLMESSVMAGVLAIRFANPATIAMNNTPGAMSNKRVLIIGECIEVWLPDVDSNHEPSG